MESLEGLKTENCILQRKLESKAEALQIMSQEVTDLHKEIQRLREGDRSYQVEPGGFSTSAVRERNAASLYRNLRTKYGDLLIERDSLRNQLEDAQADLQLLRSHLKSKTSSQPTAAAATSKEADTDMKANLPNLLQQMEQLKVLNTRQKQDIQRLLDEKEDVTKEKDQLSEMNQRLQEELSVLLRVDSLCSVDVNLLLAENRRLLGEVERLKEEKQLANTMGRRYKEALERSRNVPRSGKPDFPQLHNLLEKATFPVAHPVELSSPESLVSLSISLLETLQDRQLQTKHMRENSRNLATRVLELEQRLVSLGAAVLVHPTQTILGSSSDHPCREPVNTATLLTRSERLLTQAANIKEPNRQKKMDGNKCSPHEMGSNSNNTHSSNSNNSRSKPSSSLSTPDIINFISPMSRGEDGESRQAGSQVWDDLEIVDVKFL